MKYKNRLLTRRAFLIFSLISCVSFFAFYFNNYLVFGEGLESFARNYDTFEYIRIAVKEITDFLFPTVCALIIFPKLFEDKAYRVYSTALFICASTLIYNVPYNYLYYLMAYRYDSIESISISVLVSILYMALHALYALLIACAAKLVFTKAGGTKEALTDKVITLSFATPISSAVLTGVLIHFGFRTLSELINTVSFFIEYAQTYRVGEILYITFTYLYVLLTALFCAYICGVIYNKAVSKRITLNTDES